ncbi:hypothetical protein DFJ69_2016 [Thermomonospora umbrina]|uniref:Uncharacterized protein n=1 Tax=Thermomonospora umbrina TaxID=111806 RepID=A0A3D9SL51_9ACTN|nr:hypothetical protein DFJ69_2016 [Thermomonospora umbrina]
MAGQLRSTDLMYQRHRITRRDRSGRCRRDLMLWAWARTRECGRNAPAFQGVAVRHVRRVARQLRPAAYVMYQGHRIAGRHRSRRGRGQHRLGGRCRTGRRWRGGWDDAAVVGLSMR